MTSYQLISPWIAGDPLRAARRSADGAFLPLSMENSDCLQMLVDWKAGPPGTMKNADGTDAAYSDAAVIALGLQPAADGA